jgi:hypothetical protein
MMLAESIGDQRTKAQALASMGFCSYCAHDFDRALDESHRAMEIASRVSNDAALASAQATVGLVHALR